MEWVFVYNDGTPNDTFATQPVVTHTFDTANLYDITLVITDQAGCVASLTKPNYINATAPIPEFVFDTAICAFDSVLFTNNSSGVGLTYVWEFGDGTVDSNNTDPTHTYNLFADTNQLITIELKAFDANGCSDSISKQLLISKPVADFTADTTVSNCPPFPVNFADLSVDSIVGWNWDFGDNNTSQGSNTPLNTYSDTGTFDVELIVTDVHGCLDTAIKNSFIQINGLSASYTFTIDSNTCDQQLTFSVTGSNIDDYVWDFGDTTTGNGAVVSHRFPNGGTFIPILTVSNSLGCSAVIIQDTITITPHDLVASFSGDTIVELGSNLEISNTSTGSNTQILWAWNLGDGTSLSGTDQSVEHEYGDIGSYIVALTVTDNEGCIDSTSETVSVIEVLDEVSNVFTPNGDGLNDVFIIPNGGMESHEMHIYNRWGQLVYKNKNKVLEWYGRSFDGQLAPDGTYFYVLLSNSTTGETIETTGFITLLKGQ
ncbi:MAG: PKD domain-containing protein [Flavobacteriales bacterium]|nr:PKD domain-containing protein [Flavobacteriales bacterium]